MSEELLYVSINLARMYGVAETLEPIPYRTGEAVAKLVKRLALEYVSSGENDIVEFFEKRKPDIR
jgi:hypothetical protein